VKRGWISGSGATAKQLFATKAEALVQIKKSLPRDRVSIRRRWILQRYFKSNPSRANLP